MTCPKCTCKVATARALTRSHAERIMRTIASDLQKERPSLSAEAAAAEAMQMILLKKPSLVVSCDGCSYEWFE